MALYSKIKKGVSLINVELETMTKKCVFVSDFFFYYQETTQRFLDAVPDSLRLVKDGGVQKSVTHLTADLNVLASMQSHR